MRVMITGANSFVGRALVQRLLADGALRGKRIEILRLLDDQLRGFPEDQRLRFHIGSIANAALLRRSIADGIDVVFHLGSILDGTAEEEYALGYQLNLLASLELLNQLREQSVAPVIVYASSVAVYGDNLPARMDECAAPRPALSGGSHNLVVETALEDLARRGDLDGRAVRLPGIVTLSRESNGWRSAFMSELIRAFVDGEPYSCPVSAAANCWWMSVRCCVTNLVHAAELDSSVLIGRRVWQLPLLKLRIDQLIDALAATFGQERRNLISFAPDARLEALHGNFPTMRTPQARALGFCHDGSAASLIRHTLNPVPGVNARKAKRGDTPHETD
ncbi:NAD-dependent epimerase/dehydratase family protein [Pseudomonas sp. PCH199]|uniref:NAD-dependent epimerase/dehydratase family protein n=1 Tax=unclassified Pseudomonas TaxID=196821 RepID=UPI000BCB14D9|nr:MULTISPECIES: NAD-dependent epimerase/dehydratase family protein [unclassified Pseudomonas]MCW8277868.1 NAD-dependent epimerase/dehydratase family protein [Pseudomonas sp. PCH199]PAM82027.1 epimerase [Pseudomonas sp. ERMR1:02]